MEKIKRKMIAGTTKFLRENNIPFTKVPETENIMILVSRGKYHYCVVQFFDMPYDWHEKQRHFTMKYVYPKDLDKSVSTIKKYLL